MQKIAEDCSRLQKKCRKNCSVPAEIFRFVGNVTKSSSTILAARMQYYFE